MNEDELKIEATIQEIVNKCAFDIHEARNNSEFMYSNENLYNHENFIANLIFPIIKVTLDRDRWNHIDKAPIFESPLGDKIQFYYEIREHKSENGDRISRTLKFKYLN